MKMTIDSIIENYNQRNVFLTKIWVWIGIVSLFGLLTLYSNKTLSEIEIPLLNIKVPIEYFVPIYILILTGLIIRWGDAFHRSFSLRQTVIERFIERNKNTSIGNTSIKSRSIIDGIVYSTTTSIWGIIPDFGKKNYKAPQVYIRFLGYVILKLIIFATHFFLPSTAIVIAVVKLQKTETPISLKIIAYFLAFIGFLAILRIAYTEFRYTRIAIKNQINKKRSKKSRI